jgi:hypothetical protein
MVVRPATLRPEVFALGFPDREIVDTGKATCHESLLVELPVFVAVGSEPLIRVVVPLIGESHGNTIACTAPQFLDQPVNQLSCPLPLQELPDLFATDRKFVAVAPVRIFRIDQDDAIGVSGPKP